MFADIVGFTDMSRQVEPVAVMRFLNSLFSRYDTLLDRWGVYKVETVGDCYVVAGGLIQTDQDRFGCVTTGDTGEWGVRGEGVNGVDECEGWGVRCRG